MLSSYGFPFGSMMVDDLWIHNGSFSCVLVPKRPQHIKGTKRMNIQKLKVGGENRFFTNFELLDTNFFKIEDLFYIQPRAPGFSYSFGQPKVPGSAKGHSDCQISKTSAEKVKKNDILTVG